MQTLKIKKLKISNTKTANDKKCLVDIDFTCPSSLALVGQSGSGKSLTIKALLGLLPSNLKAELETNISLEKKDIGFVPQNPFSSLSPLTKIKNQFFCTKKEKEKVLNLVGLDEKVLEKYPAFLSGGQIQRVVLAIALCHNPKLLLLDEPTTALDKDTKNEIIGLIHKIHHTLKVNLIFVTHDIFSIKNLCEYILILKDGKIIEHGKTKKLLSTPAKEYTKALLEASFQKRSFRK